MKNFIKLIQRLHEERYMVVLTKIVAQKIPVAFLSLEPLNQAIEVAKNLCAQGLNVTNLIVVDEVSSTVNPSFNVVHISQAAQIYPRPGYVFVMDKNSPSFAKKFLSDCKVIWPSAIRGKDTEYVYEVFMTHLDELREVYESLIDEESKRTFRGYWLGCICNRIDEVVYAPTPHYFLSGFLPKASNIFMDCGTYTGWTAAQFAKLGCRVYSFELNAVNFELAKPMASKYGFTVENLGLGHYPHKAQYVNKRGTSRIDPNGSETAQIVTLDDYVREKNLPRVDYIKMDVEGAELDVLKGATATISAYKPTLALSAYHKLDDLWTLMNFVKSIRPDYEFALRQYACDYQSAPQVFNDDLKTLLGGFGLDINYSVYEECVLFAR